MLPWLVWAIIVVVGLTLPPSGAQCPPEQVDVLFVLDHSGSISDNDEGPIPNWITITDMVAAVVRATASYPGIRYAAISYGSRADLEFNLDRYIDTLELVIAFRSIRNSGGNTNTTGALRLSRTEVWSSLANRPTAYDVLVLITDGVPSVRYEADGLVPEANRVKALGVRLIGIGVTTEVDATVMRSIVSEPVSENFFGLSNFTQLPGIIESLVTCITGSTTTTLSPTTSTASTTTSSFPTSSSTSLPSPTSTTSTTTLSTTTTTTGPRSTTTLGPAECRHQADIVIVLDASGGRLDFTQFNEVRQFLVEMLTQLRAVIESGAVRVGMVRFADNAVYTFNLNTYLTNFAGLTDAVRTAAFIGGGTNTGLGLQYARTMMFTDVAGERPGIQNFILLITAGQSNNRTLTMSEAFDAREAGIFIVAITLLSNDVPEFVVEMNAVVNSPAMQTRISVDMPADLSLLAKNRTIDLLCNNVDDCRPPSLCAAGSTCVDRVAGFYCICPPGVSGVTCSDTCRHPADVVLMLDVSGSVGEFTLNYDDFVRNLILRLNADSRVGFLVFSDQPSIEFQLNTFTSLEDAVNSITTWAAAGTTNMADALREVNGVMFTEVNGDRVLVPNYVVVITDGQPNNKTATLLEAERLRGAGVVIIVVGVGPDIDVEELRLIASNPTSSTVLPSTPGDGSNIGIDVIDGVVYIICRNELACQSAPCLNGGTCIDGVAGTYLCRCPDRFTGPQCERGCSAVIDLIFVLDVSGSTRIERFDAIKQFVIDLIELMEIGTDKTRVGAMIFSDHTIIKFHLNRYSTIKDLQDAVRAFEFPGGKTNISGSLRVLIDSMYLPQNGGRANAQRMAIYITDGAANVDVDKTLPYAIEARNDLIMVIAVSVGLDANLALLSGIVTRPPEAHLFVLTSSRNLPNIIGDVVNASCNDVNECQPNPCQNGGRCLDRYSDYECECPAPFTGKPCTRNCSRSVLDVAFVTDVSVEIDETSEMRELLELLTYGLPVAADRVRLALVVYSSDVTARFFLGNYSVESQVLNALVFDRPSGVANTAEALTFTYQDVFSSRRGDRSGAPNIAIVITSGLSASISDTAAAAAAARRAGIEIYAVAYAASGRPGMHEIALIASDGPNHILTLGDASGTPSAVANALLDSLCQP